MTPLESHVKTLEALKDKNKAEGEEELRKLLEDTDYIEILTTGTEEEIASYIQELFIHNHQENKPIYEYAANSAVKFAESMI